MILWCLRFDQPRLSKIDRRPLIFYIEKMRRDSTAVRWLVGGWLLMSPPLVKDAKAPGGFRVDPAAKVADWTQVSAHDSATGCQRAKAEKALDAIALAEQPGGRKDVLDEMAATARHAVCVPAEYIYPPPAAEEEDGAAAPAGLSASAARTSPARR